MLLAFDAVPSDVAAGAGSHDVWSFDDGVDGGLFIESTCFLAGRADRLESELFLSLSARRAGCTTFTSAGAGDKIEVSGVRVSFSPGWKDRTSFLSSSNVTLVARKIELGFVTVAAAVAAVEAAVVVVATTGAKTGAAAAAVADETADATRFFGCVVNFLDVDRDCLTRGATPSMMPE